MTCERSELISSLGPQSEQHSAGRQVVHVASDCPQVTRIAVTQEVHGRKDTYTQSSDHFLNENNIVFHMVLIFCMKKLKQTHYSEFTAIIMLLYYNLYINENKLKTTNEYKTRKVKIKTIKHR